jgi:hypothetical protein
MFGRKREPQVPKDPRRTGRKPGHGARERQQELSRAAPVKTFFMRLLNIHTDERAWRLGAAGEEHVGALLEQLRPRGWHVEHDVQVGDNGANLDHLVIGPPGVFVLNTKNVDGNVWVGGEVIMVNGHRRNFVKKLEAEAQRVRRCLLGATRRRALWVQGLLVFVDPDLTVKQQPRNVAVLHDEELVQRLLERPAQLEANEVRALVRAAQQESTWR